MTALRHSNAPAEHAKAAPGGARRRVAKAAAPVGPSSEHAPAVAAAPEKSGLLEHAWVDRDIGWLAFNNRVLHEALDERTPLLERLKFLAIVTSNLDEFFMKRVGILRGKALVEDREDPLPRRRSAPSVVRVQPA